MTDTQTTDQNTEDQPITGTVVTTAGGGALALLDAATVDQLLAPYTITPDVWLRGLLTDDDFPEQDAEAMTVGILAAILGADSPEEALAVMNVQRAREMCGNEPGGRSDVLDIVSARPLKSTYDQGAACYVIFKATIVRTGERIQVTTGARAVQSFLLACTVKGWFPVRACLEIRRDKTASGYNPLNMVSGI